MTTPTSISPESVVVRKYGTAEPIFKKPERTQPEEKTSTVAQESIVDTIQKGKPKDFKAALLEKDAELKTREAEIRKLKDLLLKQEATASSLSSSPSKSPETVATAATASAETVIVKSETASEASKTQAASSANHSRSPSPTLEGTTAPTSTPVPATVAAQSTTQQTAKVEKPVDNLVPFFPTAADILQHTKKTQPYFEEFETARKSFNALLKSFEKLLVASSDPFSLKSDRKTELENLVKEYQMFHQFFKNCEIEVCILNLRYIKSAAKHNPIPEEHLKTFSATQNIVKATMLNNIEFYNKRVAECSEFLVKLEKSFDLVAQMDEKIGLTRSKINTLLSEDTSLLTTVSNTVSNYIPWGSATAPYPSPFTWGKSTLIPENNEITPARGLNRFPDTLKKAIEEIKV